LLSKKLLGKKLWVYITARKHFPVLASQSAKSFSSAKSPYLRKKLTMLTNHPQICLFQPEIPQNTGNIGRLAAATQCRLHLVKPFGFGSEDRNLLRPGLDYWPYLDLEIHDHLDELLSQFSLSEVAFFSKSAKKSYLQLPKTTQLLVFGRETSGLPDWIWQKYPELFYKIPIYHHDVRSLNIANSVSIITYHLLALKQVPHLPDA
jgi:tRNA (cytidine/uridine-2'-O-)-methyltransferase